MNQSYQTAEEQRIYNEAMATHPYVIPIEWFLFAPVFIALIVGAIYYLWTKLMKK